MKLKNSVSFLADSSLILSFSVLLLLVNHFYSGKLIKSQVFNSVVSIPNCDYVLPSLR